MDEKIDQSDWRYWMQKLQRWYEVPYQGKEFQTSAPGILTEKGERVRSKSEKILADYFTRKNIYKNELYDTRKSSGEDINLT